MPDPITPHVAGNVRAEMARARVSGRKLADTLGMTNQSLAQRISGQIPFDVDLLARVAAVLDLPIERLLAMPAETTAAAS